MHHHPRASLLVIEDDPAILHGLVAVLIFHGFAVEGAADGHAGLEKALSGGHDLIILDVMLPGIDGFSICRRVRKKWPGRGILMLTAKGAEDDIVTGFRAGADDYVSKPFSLRELMVRVEAVLRRTGKGSGEATVSLAGVLFDGGTLSASKDGVSVALTRREMEIICYLHRHRDRIVSKKALLTDVWGYADAEIETRTVDIHVLKLRKKIGRLLGDTPLIVTVRGEGYRLEKIE
jgi:two-component system response regulator RegX3